MEKFLYLFLTITFALHGIAFTIIGLLRRKAYYFFLTSTFIFLTAIYLIKLEGLALEVPGTSLPLTWLLRSGASLCTLAYLCTIYSVEGSWLWKLRHRRGASNSRSDSRWIKSG